MLFDESTQGHVSDPLRSTIVGETELRDCVHFTFNGIRTSLDINLDMAHTEGLPKQYLN
jgi:hypothetical protein